MKKLAMTVLTIFSSGMAYALPLGNPAEASLMSDGVFCEGWCADPCDPCVSWFGMWSIRVGFYGDYVYNRNMEVSSNGADIEDFEINTNAAYFAFNLCNKYDLFATVGVTQINFQSPLSGFGNPTLNIMSYARFLSDFSWSVGGRGTLWECGYFSVGLEGQYFQTRPTIGSFNIAGQAVAYLPEESVRYFDWQVGLGVSYRINIGACGATALVPYAGARWGGAKFDLDDFPIETVSVAILRDLEDQKRWGWALGVTLVGCSKTAVTVEGRFADQKALYVNGQLRF